MAEGFRRRCAGMPASGCRCIGLGIAVSALAFGLVGSAGPAQGAAVPAVCWAVPDDAATLYTFTPSPSAVVPPTESPLGRMFDGEGMLYRAATNSIGVFVDSPSRLWYRELGSGVETVTSAEIPGHVEAAAYWVDPAAPAVEQLWVVIGARKLYRLNAATAAIEEGPIELAGFEGSIGGLAIHPTTGEMFFTDDHPESELWKLDRNGFVATKIATLRLPDGNLPDAEALDFDAAGVLYTEEENGDDKSVAEFRRYLYAVDLATGAMTKAAGPFPGSGDLEGVACNAGAAAFATAPEPPPPAPAVAAIDVEKFVQGEDADTAPGVVIAEGFPVAFRYDITNSGGVGLHDISVVDDRGVVIVCPGGGPSIPSLAPGAQVVCTGGAIATRGDYVNVATATGLPDGGGPAVSDTDAAHYVGWPGSPGELPETGAPSIELGGIAAAVVVAGFLMVVVAGRRRFPA